MPPLALLLPLLAASGDSLLLVDTEFAVDDWHYEQAAFNILRDMRPEQQRASDCVACRNAMHGEERGGFREACSQACLESFLPPAWQALWIRNVSPTERKVWKPAMLSYDETFRFYGKGGAEYVEDTAFTCHDGRDWLNGFGVKTSMEFDRWRVRGDSLILEAGRKVTTWTWPSGVGSDTVLIPRLADRIQWIHRPGGSGLDRRQVMFRFRGMKFTEIRTEDAGG